MCCVRRDSSQPAIDLLTMRRVLWTAVVVLIVLVLAGDKVRNYFARAPNEITAAKDAARDNTSTKEREKPPVDKADSDKRSASGAYVPSPADAPELYDSPTRRLGF